MYTIKKGADTALLELGKVACYPWGGDHRPEMLFKIGRETDHLCVFLRCYEENPVVTTQERNGPVWNDSCMELFIAPTADASTGYFNFEINAYPALLLHYGVDGVPAHRGPIEWPPEDFDLKSRRGRDDFGRAYWELTYRVPYALFAAYCGVSELRSGDVIRANLYKCGSNDQPKHYGCWHPIDTEKYPGPNFHVPDCFGKMKVE